MKKLLIIALLFWGCEGFGVFKHSHDGVCARKIVYAYVCYSKWTHKECLTKSGSSTVQWYSDVTCEEFCEGEPSSLDCSVDNEPY